MRALGLLSSGSKPKGLDTYKCDLCVFFYIHITSVLDDKMLEDHVLFNCFYFA